MTIDDIWDDGMELFEDPGIFDSSLFDDSSLTRYSNLLPALNEIAAVNFEFTDELIEYLRITDEDEGDFLSTRLEKNSGKDGALARAQGYLDVIRNRATLTEKGFEAVVKKLDRMRDSEHFSQFVEYVLGAAPSIAKYVDHERLKKGLDRLSEVAGEDYWNEESRDSTKVFVRAITAPRKVTSKVAFKDLSDSLRELFDTAVDTELLEYSSFLTEFPKLKHVDADSFVYGSNTWQRDRQNYAFECSEVNGTHQPDKTIVGSELPLSYKLDRVEEKFFGSGSTWKLLKSWIPKSASPAQGRFLGQTILKYPPSDIRRLGRNLLQTMALHANHGDEISAYLRDCAVPKLIGMFFTSEHGPPSWMKDVVCVLENSMDLKSLPKLEAVVSAAIREGALEIRAARIAENYRDLKKKIARNDMVPAKDYLKYLHEDLLQTIAMHEASVVPTLRKMGVDFDRINSAYEKSGLRPNIVFELYKHDHSHSRIEEMGERTAKYHDLLKLLEDNDYTIACLARRGLLESDLEFVESFRGKANWPIKLIAFNSVCSVLDDPVSYLSRASDNAISYLGMTDGLNNIKAIVRTVPPEDLGDLALLAEESLNVRDLLEHAKERIDWKALWYHCGLFQSYKGAAEGLPEFAKFLIAHGAEEDVERKIEAFEILGNFSDKNYSEISEFLGRATEVELSLAMGMEEGLYPFSETDRILRLEEVWGLISHLTPRVGDLSEWQSKIRTICAGVFRHLDHQEDKDKYLGDLVEAVADFSAVQAELSYILLRGQNQFCCVTEKDQVTSISNLDGKLNYVDALLKDNEKYSGAILNYARNQDENALKAASEWICPFDSHIEAKLETLADPDWKQRVEEVEPGMKSDYFTLYESVEEKGKFKVLPHSDLYTVAKAYNLAKTAGKVDVFVKNLDQCLLRGSVGAWANTIVKAFEKSGVGGGNYREVFREVVA